MSDMIGLVHGELAQQRRLTQREIDIVSLIAVGQSNKAIAIELGIAPETIKTHLKRIFLKLSAQAVQRRLSARNTRNSVSSAPQVFRVDAYSSSSSRCKKVPVAAASFALHNNR